MSKEKVKIKNEPNIIFVGKREKFNAKTGKAELVPMDAPTEFNSVSHRFDIPKGIENGVFMDEKKAQVLKETFPDLFKTFVKKG